MDLVEKVRWFLDSGGFTSWLILVSAILLIVVSVERFFFLFFEFSFKADNALRRIRDAIVNGDYPQAIQVCNAKISAPELAVVKSGLVASESGREAMKSALGAAVLEVSRKCEKRISIVALIAAIATLLGLLGTITGLIKTFAALAEADASEKAQLLGAGISEAMYSTASGLGLGIVAMICHTLFTTKVDGIVGSSQDAGYKLMTWVEESERSRVSG